MVKTDATKVKVTLNKSVYDDLVILGAVMGFKDPSLTILYLMDTFGTYCEQMGLSKYKKFQEVKAAREGK